MSDEFRGHEPALLRALGISWRHGSRKHRRCPFPYHEDKHPSWRWDDGDSRWYCSGSCGNGDIFDAVVRMGKARGYIEAKDWCRQAIGKADPVAKKPKPAPKLAEYAPATKRPPLEQLRHPVHGLPTPENIATYKFADGKIAELRVRYDHANGKEVVPWTLFGGRWTRRQMPGLRPLYRLSVLLSNPDKPVLFVEGEGRKAKRAVELFPDYVVTATSGGCKSFAGMDYTPLAGRRVTVWPDNDAPGRQYARDVCTRALEAGAIEARIVDVPEWFCPAWDLGDDPGSIDTGDEASITTDDLREMLDEARIYQKASYKGLDLPKAASDNSKTTINRTENASDEMSRSRYTPSGHSEDATGDNVLPFSTLGAAAVQPLRQSTQPQSKFKLTRLRDITPLLNGMWLIKGLLPARGLCTVFGEPGCGKSFLTLDMVLHVAAGREYAGRKVKQAGVVYIAAEGQGGFRNRVVEAAKALELEENAQFDLIEVAPNLGVKDGDADELIRAIEDQAQPGDAPVGAIVVDTTSQTMGGENENLEGMAMFIQNANAISAHFACLSIAVHHVGVSDGNRPRGWSGLHGANDTEIKVTSLSNPHTAEIAKQKDGEPGLQFQFNLNCVEVGKDEDGDMVTTCIVDLLGEPQKAAKSETKKPADRQGRRSIRVFESAFDEALMSSSEDYHVDGDGPLVRAVFVHQIRAYFAKRWATDEQDKKLRAKKTSEAFRSALKSLPPRYHTREEAGGERIWRVS